MRAPKQPAVPVTGVSVYAACVDVCCVRACDRSMGEVTVLSRVGSVEKQRRGNDGKGGIRTPQSVM